MLKKIIIAILSFALLASVAISIYLWLEAQKYPKPAWSQTEKISIASLWIVNLPPLVEDPSNAVSDNIDAAKFGHQLFFDTRFSSNGKVACMTCHDPDKHFTDGRALAIGTGVTKRSSPSIVGTAYHPFIFWDGRADSQWSQALGPMESAVEHGGSRMQYAHLVAKDKNYRRQYEILFGALPDFSDNARFPARAGPVDKKANPAVAEAWKNMQEEDRRLVTQVYVNIGKSIAAYERLLIPAASRFDTYAESIHNQSSDSLDVLTRDEAEGLRLFIGEARCIECHNGPLFSNDSFANIGTPSVKDKPFDFGRSLGAQQVLKNEFNCAGKYSDAKPHECSELRFIKRTGDEIIGGFKTPGLRNITATAPYMHSGQMADLDAVMDHYNKAPQPKIGHSMLIKLDFEAYQLDQLIAFLKTLDSEVAVSNKWLKPPATMDNNTKNALEEIQ
jgi:cytochrome c peroxidase